MNFNQVLKKVQQLEFLLEVLSQLFLKYAYTLDILIHQFVHIEFSVDTLPILLNF